MVRLQRFFVEALFFNGYLVLAGLGLQSRIGRVTKKKTCCRFRDLSVHSAWDDHLQVGLPGSP